MKLLSICGEAAKALNVGKHIDSHLIDLSLGVKLCWRECIYSDLIGTWAILYSGFWFMLLFIDYFRRGTLVYSIKEKSEVFFKSLEFKEIVEGDCGWSVEFKNQKATDQT